MTKEKIAIDLAKAHIETVLTDYIIMGFNRNNPQNLQEYINVGSTEALIHIYQKFLERTNDLSNKQND